MSGANWTCRIIKSWSHNSFETFESIRNDSKARTLGAVWVEAERHWTVSCHVWMLYTYIYWIHTDAMITDARIKDARRKEAGRKTQEDFFRKIFTSHFIARVRKGCWRVACERMPEIERKLHILTPLLWPSRCVFIVLLMFNQRPWGPLYRGFSEGPLGRVWPSLPHLVSTVWNSAGNCIGGFRGPPRLGMAEVLLGRVWPSLPHLISNSLGVCWQLLWHPKLNWVK